MRDVHIDTDVKNSFHCGPWNFVSINAGDFVSCPPHVVTSVAMDRLAPDAQLELPEDYDNTVLGSIRSLTSHFNREIPVSFRMAAELAVIGAQLQDLNGEGKVQPPLDYFERQSIRHLLREVRALGVGDMVDAGFSDEDMAYVALAQVTIGRGRE